MKVVHLNYSDSLGGASLAAFRIHKALRAHGVYSRMFVNSACSGDGSVTGPERRIERLTTLLRPLPANLVMKCLKTDNKNLHSPAIIPSFWHRRLNRSDFDIVHLHWINNEMMSIPDIGRIRKPIVWTLHDMWAFCGAEHYTEDNRWKYGYFRDNRPKYESGPDLNRWVWNRKVRHWDRPMHIVTPSRWLAHCVKQSALMHNWPVEVIPNCIDIHRWIPVEKSLAKALLGLAEDMPIILFGAQGGSRDRRKGHDLLQKAVARLKDRMKRLQIVIFGESTPEHPQEMGYPTWYAGHLYDEISLRILYSAADVMIIPSRQDNLPNTGIEAHACGTPIVGFDIGGLSDIVGHEKTGYLAKPFDPSELAHGIEWVVTDDNRHKSMCKEARSRAVSLWTNDKIATQYKCLYEKIIQHKYDD